MTVVLAPHPSPEAPALHSGTTIARYYGMHIMGATFPVTAGLLLYGWRGLLVIVGLLISTALATRFWRRIGQRGPQLQYHHTMYLALLLALMLPAHLASTELMLDRMPIYAWPVIPAAGFALTAFVWMLGGVGSGRVHPVLMTYLLLMILFQQLLVPHWILQRNRLFLGDILDVPASEVPLNREWVRADIISAHPALYREPAAQRLIFFTTRLFPPDRSFLSLDGLLRDSMPPLQDLVLGGHPGPIGLSSAIAVIIGGLFLIYRQLIDWRIPLFTVISAYLAFLILPIPLVIGEDANKWSWFAIGAEGVSAGVVLTFIHYEIMAGPLLFVSFFLASASAVRPMGRPARIIYAVLVGIFCAGFQLYAAVAVGPYIALMVVSLLTPMLDKVFRPRPLV